MVKNPPAMQEMQETWVQSLGREDPLEEGANAGDMRRGFDHWVGKIPWKSTHLKQLITHTGSCVEYISWNARRRELQAGIKTARRNINNLSYADDTILMAESGEELKNLLMRVKEESEKVGLKLNMKKTMIMASGPITSWQIDGETMETVTDFIFLGSKITVDGDCGHKIKRRLLLGKKSYDKPRQYI